jgi:hypothetical protein
MSYDAYRSVLQSAAAADFYVYVAWMDGSPVLGSGSQDEIWLKVGDLLL